jgi:hypothetical protein
MAAFIEIFLPKFCTHFSFHLSELDVQIIVISKFHYPKDRPGDLYKSEVAC